MVKTVVTRLLKPFGRELKMLLLTCPLHNTMNCFVCPGNSSCRWWCKTCWLILQCECSIWLTKLCVTDFVKWRNPLIICYQIFYRCSDYVPDISALYEWSTWLTPTFRKNRFNTMFYICFIENALNQSEDNTETVHSDWLSPYDSLRLHGKKKIILQFPQIYENDRLQRYVSQKSCAIKVHVCNWSRRCKESD